MLILLLAANLGGRFYEETALGREAPARYAAPGG
jgi:hypothetical protein